VGDVEAMTNNIIKYTTAQHLVAVIGTADCC
jgi:hypothetical protein